jgi:hypothetical protein
MVRLRIQTKTTLLSP